MACEPVGEKEIAERLRVRKQTVAMWLHRPTVVPFPPPRWRVSGNPAWNWPDVERWARETRRLPVAGRARSARRRAR